MNATSDISSIPTTARRSRKAQSLLLTTALTLPIAFAGWSSAAAAAPALVNVCTGLGVTLPVLQPVTNTASGLLGGILAPVNGALDSVIGNVNLNVQQALSGKSIGVGVFDPATNTVVSVPSAQCNISANSLTLDNNLGLSAGGGQITGLGGTGNLMATAGDASAIALGNGSSTGAGLTNAIALGNGATVTTANSAALGAGAVASRGALSAYTAFGLSGPQTSAGEVSIGRANALHQLTNVAAGSANTDGATVGQLRGAIEPLQATSRLAVAYMADTTGNPTATVDLAGNANLPTGTTRVRLTGVAPATLSGTSLDAVNGSQLAATGTSTATTLGAGSTFDAATGRVTAPRFTIRGGIYTNVGSAFDAVDTALTSITNGSAGAFVSNNAAGAPGAVASGANASAGGFGASATGRASLVVGNAATDAGVANSTVIGQAAGIRAGLGGSNVALGQGAQASTGARTGYTAFGLAAAQTSAGEVAVGSATGTRQITHVAAGAAATDAVNVGQLRGASAALGTTVTAALGGGASYDAANGQISGPSYAVGATTYTSVGGAIAALNTSVASGPVQYSTAAAPTTANPGVVSNDVTLVGTAVGTPVGLHNIAPGTIAAGGTDAANTGQLYAGNQSIATIIGGGATYNTTNGTVTDPSYTIQGNAYTTIGGALTALSNSINGTGNQKYFDVNSNLGNASATAANAVAIGPVAVATAENAVALGNGSAATGTNSVALGAGSSDGGLANVVSVGAAGAERRVTNVAAGTLAAGSTDAINGGQLFQTNTQVANLGRTSVQYDTDGTGSTLSSVTLSSDQGGPVTIHNLAPGVAPNDAATVGQVQTATANSVQYTTMNGVKTNTIALAGGTPGGVTITNVAAGVGAGDAVNVGQLQAATGGLANQARAYTDQQVGNLAAYTDRQINRARKDAAGGTALALAATGLRYEDRPGKTSIAGAASYYKDQFGIAFGLGSTSDSGRYRVNAALTASPTMPHPDVGAVVGASMTLD